MCARAFARAHVYGWVFSREGYALTQYVYRRADDDVYARSLPVGVIGIGMCVCGRTHMFRVSMYA
jgi:hypothetical protein